MGRKIALASGKGGTGKSVLTAGIGESLAASGKKVLIVDANPGLRGMEMMLGLDEDVIYTFSDVLSGRMKLTECCIPSREFPGLELLAAPQLKNPGDFSAEDYQRLVSLASPYYDYILLDGPSGVEQGLKNVLAAVDELLLVVTPDRLSVRGADRVRGIGEAQGLRSVSLLVNRVRPKWFRKHLQLSPEEISGLCGCPLTGVIPESGKLRLAADRGNPLFPLEDESAEALRLTAEVLAGAGKKIWLPDEDRSSGKDKKKRK